MTTVVLLCDDGSEEVLVRVDAGRADPALLDGLCRLQLAAKRAGRAVRVRDAPQALRDLIELAGLAGVLTLEPRGQPEVAEQLGVEEVVQPRDPPA